MQPDPTSPLDLDAVRERFLSYSDHQTGAHARGWACCSAHRPADDVPALLAALAEAQRERDEAVSYAEFADRAGMRLAEEPTAARAAAERMRPVVEKAQRWRAWLADELDNDQAETDLAAAVDTYETQEGTG